MVRGLDIFKKYFEAYPDNYLIIGGAARDIIIEDAGFSPKGTKDIDIVLVIEALTEDFVKQFWLFIKDGKYKHQEKSSGERKYYRFYNPANTEFPFMIELFSRKPDLVLLSEPAHLTPIPIESDLSSLSAILLSNDYYGYILDHSIVDNDVHIANKEALICLKAKAFIDMSERKAQGEVIDNRNIKKHKNDIFRLAITLAPDDVFEVPETIKNDIQTFVNAIDGDLPGKELFKSMGLGSISAEIIFNQILKSFQLVRE